MADDLRTLIAEKIRAGRLPRECHRVFGGPGSEHTCVGCGLPTRISGLEFECEFADITVRAVMCKSCFWIWLELTRDPDV